jgi:hypothetical protein
LKDAGIPAYVAPVLNPKPEMLGTYYRVRAGDFATTKAALEYGRIHLTPLGRDFWVDLKDRDSEALPAAPVSRIVPVSEPALQPKIVEPAPAPTPAPVASAPKASLPIDSTVPRNLEGKPAVADTGTVQDW